MDWNQVRALFPAAERYTYLNTAAAPPLSILAAREGKRYYNEMAEDADVAWDRWVSQVALHELNPIEPGQILALAGDKAVDAPYRLAAGQKRCRNRPSIGPSPTACAATSPRS